MSKVFLTPRFAAIALLGGGGVALLGLIGVPVAVALGGWAVLCGLAAAVDIALTPSPQQVEVSRRAPSTAMRDEPVQMFIELRNLGTREIRGAVQDTWPKHSLMRSSARQLPGNAQARASSSPWIAVAAAPGAPLRIPFTLAPRRRGTLRSGFIAVRSRGPLGLGGREFRHALPGTISVAWRPRRKPHAGASAPQPEFGLAAAHLHAIDEANGAALTRALDELRYYAGLYSGTAQAGVSGIPVIGAVAEYLPRLAGRDPAADQGARLRALIAHLSDLFDRARHGSEQQRRLLVSRYVETLGKLTSLLSEDYYGDILRNPGYWSDPEQRIAQILLAVEAVDQEVIENVRQLSESRDIEFKVALESLTRPQNGAKLSDIYTDRKP